MPPRKAARGAAKATGGAAKVARRGAGAKGYRLPDRLPEGLRLVDLHQQTWQLGRSIGVGGFGEIYLATQASGGADATGNKSRATAASAGDSAEHVVKIEPHSNGPLFCEVHCYMRLCGGGGAADSLAGWMRERRVQRLGMPHFAGSGSVDHGGQRYRFLVMRRYGTDLQRLLEANAGRFPLETVLRVGVQVIDTLEYIHSKGYVHADIKAQNLLLGREKGWENQVFLVDFGLACRYQSPTDGVHYACTPDARKAHNGTIEFASRDAHLGANSRRGDLEILGYNLLLWASGQLPWLQQLADGAETVARLKTLHMTRVPQMVAACFGATSRPYEAETIREFIERVAAMTFEQVPDYDGLRALLLEPLLARGRSHHYLRTAPLQFSGASGAVPAPNTTATTAAAGAGPAAAGRHDNGATAVKKRRKCSSPVRRVGGGGGGAANCVAPPVALATTGGGGGQENQGAAAGAESAKVFASRRCQSTSRRRPLTPVVVDNAIVPAPPVSPPSFLADSALDVEQSSLLDQQQQQQPPPSLRSDGKLSDFDFANYDRALEQLRRHPSGRSSSSSTPPKEGGAPLGRTRAGSTGLDVSSLASLGRLTAAMRQVLAKARAQRLNAAQRPRRARAKRHASRNNYARLSLSQFQSVPTPAMLDVMSRLSQRRRAAAAAAAGGATSNSSGRSSSRRHANASSGRRAANSAATAAAAAANDDDGDDDADDGGGGECGDGGQRLRVSLATRARRNRHLSAASSDNNDSFHTPPSSAQQLAKKTKTTTTSAAAAAVKGSSSRRQLRSGSVYSTP